MYPLYELDANTGEATGQVLAFCSVACRSLFDHEHGVWADGSPQSAASENDVCCNCGKHLET
jgi:hypothetical protein